MVLDTASILGAILLAVAMAGAASLFAARVHIEAMVRALEALRLLVPIVVFAIIGALIESQKETLAFDQIGAQLIVVLLLALALEARFFRVRGTDERVRHDGLPPRHGAACGGRGLRDGSRPQR